MCEKFCIFWLFPVYLDQCRQENSILPKPSDICCCLAIVLGTEGDGLHEQTIDSCDYTVKIPMSHGVDSLNVAAASAVAFWELAK